MAVMRVVTVFDTPKLQDRVAQIFEDVDPEAVLVPVEAQAEPWAQLAQQEADIFLLSTSLLPEAAEQGIQALRAPANEPWVIGVSHREDAEECAQLMAAGCRAVIYSGISLRSLEKVLPALLSERRRFLARLAAGEQANGHGTTAQKSKPEIPSLADFASSNPSMQAFMDMVQRVVASDTTLLIQGETGVGKELLARAIHEASARARGPFIAINCGGLPETLLESELFGHEKGAFTGATHVRKGCFELAHKGTVLLDEVGDMPAHFQVKLLRVLQERKVTRIGGEKAFDVDVRVMAATNQDLHKQVAAKSFRNDLFFRLSVVTLTIPPLRERREDLEGLISRYVESFRAQIGRDVTGVAPAAHKALLRYPWPGNVRELMNVLERAVLLCKGREITLDDLPAHLVDPVAVVGEGAPSASTRLLKGIARPGELPMEVLELPLLEVRQKVLEKLEREYLKGLLKATEGRVGETAKLAGIEPRTLYDMMKRYDLHKEDFRPFRAETVAAAPPAPSEAQSPELAPR
ncbi:MAG: sigma-54 dependent transcriptional regulator [Planctomycetota bacterium]